MPFPKIEEGCWICPMCQLYKSWNGQAVLIGKPIVFMICEKCFLDLIRNFKVRRNLVRLEISLRFFKEKLYELEKTIQSLEGLKP